MEAERFLKHADVARVQNGSKSEDIYHGIPPVLLCIL